MYILIYFYNILTSSKLDLCFQGFVKILEYFVTFGFFLSRVLLIRALLPIPM